LKYRHSFFLLLLAFILQTTIMNHFNINGVTPNLILSYIVILTFLFGGYDGIIFGILFGLVLDIGLSPIIGISALCNLVAALFCLEMRRYLYKDNMLSIVIVSVLSTICYALIFWGTTSLFGIHFDFSHLLKMQGIAIVYNGIVGIILYVIISRRNRKRRRNKYMYRNSLQEARSLYKS
jgi:rod shape-determining protein MreD